MTAIVWPDGAGLFGGAPHGYANKKIELAEPVTCPGCGHTWSTESVRSWWLSHTRCLGCLHTLAGVEHRLPTEDECAPWKREPVDARWVYELEPTIAMERGDSYVAQCAYCGLLAAVPGPMRDEKLNTATLGDCPRCQSDHGWWNATEPVGPFKGWQQLDLFAEATS